MSFRLTVPILSLVFLALTETFSSLTLEDNGKKATWKGGGTVGGKKIDNFDDVWRRVSK